VSNFFNELVNIRDFTSPSSILSSSITGVTADLRGISGPVRSMAMSSICAILLEESASSSRLCCSEVNFSFVAFPRKLREFNRRILTVNVKEG